MAGPVAVSDSRVPAPPAQPKNEAFPPSGQPPVPACCPPPTPPTSTDRVWPAATGSVNSTRPPSPFAASLPSDPAPTRVTVSDVTPVGTVNV